MTYSFDDLYNKKTNRELFSIYTSGTISEKAKAHELLKKRNFDFDNIQKYKDEWELEKLINDYNSIWKSSISENFSGFDMLSVFPMVNLLIIIYLIGDVILQLIGNKEKDLPNTLIILTILVIVELLLIWLFKERKKKRILIKKRIKYLKSKIRAKN